MQEIINIIKNYWPQLLAILMFIASFILQLLKKKPVKVVNEVFEFLLSSAIEAVKFTEETFKGFSYDNVDFQKLNNELFVYVSKDKKSAEKLSVALKFIEDRFKSIYPELNFDDYRDYAIGAIEDILSTPQKHDNK